MRIGTLYTLYGRRAGAELYFEKILMGMLEQYADITFVVFCNEESYNILPNNEPRLKKKLISALNSQYKKMLWLETVSSKIVERELLNAFWIPSGTNNFPGKWKTPTVVTFHDLGEYFIKGKYDLQRTLYRKMICIPRSIRRSSLITAVSKTTAKDLQFLFPLKVSPHVIYSGASPREIKQEKIEDPRGVVKAKTSVDVEEIIFAPGRTDYKGKGLDILLRAYKEFTLSVKEPPRLILAGPKGEYHDKLERDINELGLSGKAHWVGRVDDECMEALYQISKMVIISSRYEGFGFPLLEAMRRKVPIICSEGGALPEIAGEAALFFKPGDVSDLCRSMVHLYGDDDLIKRLIIAGENRVKDFNWETTFSNMHQVFSEVSRCSGSA